MHPARQPCATIPRLLHVFCADKNYPIRCNSLHPAAILTPLWDAMLGEGEAREKALQAISAGIPVGKMGDPMDVAYAAV